DPQPAAVFEGDALRQFARCAQVIEMVRDQAGVASHLILAALLAVDLLDHGQRDYDLVVLEGKDRVRIVQKDVRVEDVDLLHAFALRGTDVVAYSPCYSNATNWAIFV